MPEIDRAATGSASRDQGHRVQLLRLLRFARGHWRGGLLAIAAIGLNAAMVGAFYYVVERLIDPIVRARDLHKLTQAAALLAAVSLGRFLSDAIYIFLANRLTQRIIKDLRIALFTHLHKLSVGYLESRSTGELMSRVINDVSSLQSLMVSQIIEGIRAVLTLVAVFAVMLEKSWKLTVISAVGLPLVALIVYQAGRRVRLITQQVQEHMAQVSSVLQESLSLMRVIQSFAMEQHEIDRFTVFNQSVYKRTMRGIRIQAFLSPFVEFVGVLGFLLAMMVGGWLVIRGHLTPERLFAFLITVPYAVTRFKILSGLQVAYGSAAAAIQRVFDVLDTRPQVREKPDAIVLPRLAGHVEFDRVSFGYRTGHEVLHGISFRLEPGQVVALAGESGAGKTTISSLLLRLYDVTEGSIRVDGHDVRDVTLNSLRKQISIVPQETVLFVGSIRDNIAFARPEATQEEITQAALQANAHDFIMSLPEGYDTQVGERGMKLSGGQRQRIAIARALLRDPRILILDEATSSLDAKSESLVQEALQRLMANRTTIVISHRYPTIRNVDWILFLSDGRIVEEGKHDQLLASRGQYRKLFDFQQVTGEAVETMVGEPQ